MPKVNRDYSKELRTIGRTQVWTASRIGITSALLNHYIKGRREMPTHIEHKLNSLINRG